MGLRLEDQLELLDVDAELDETRAVGQRVVIELLRLLVDDVSVSLRHHAAHLLLVALGQVLRHHVDGEVREAVGGLVHQHLDGDVVELALVLADVRLDLGLPGVVPPEVGFDESVRFSLAEESVDLVHPLAVDGDAQDQGVANDLLADVDRHGDSQQNECDRRNGDQVFQMCLQGVVCVPYGNRIDIL